MEGFIDSLREVNAVDSQVDTSKLKAENMGQSISKREATAILTIDSSDS